MKQRILKIKQITSKAGDKLVIITTAKRDHILSVATWLNATNNDANYDAYIGGSITIDYYQVGDTMFRGDTCTAADKIPDLDSLALEKNPEVVAMAVAASVDRRSAELEDYAALRKRQRAEQQEKLAKALNVDGKKVDGGTGEILADGAEANLEGEKPF